MMIRLAPALMVVLSLTAVSVAAQEADDTGQERAPHTAPIFVTTSEATGEIKGQLLDLGPDKLALLVDGARRELPTSSVSRIAVSGDSVKNGAIIGAAVMGGWCAIICSQGIENANQAMALVAINALFGALVGAGIDALHTGRTPIYRTPSGANATSGPRFTLSSTFRF